MRGHDGTRDSRKRDRLTRAARKRERKAVAMATAKAVYLLSRKVGSNGTRYDEARSGVVVAWREDEAREILSRQACDEGPEVWLDPERSSCRLVGYAVP